MQAGIPLKELLKTLEEQLPRKKDYIADTRRIGVEVKDGKIKFRLNGDNYGMTDIGSQQIATKTGIPKRYWDRMLEEAPDLAVQNIKHWFSNEPHERKVRCMDKNII